MSLTYYSFGKIIKQFNFTHKPMIFKHSNFFRVKGDWHLTPDWCESHPTRCKKVSVGKYVENVQSFALFVNESHYNGSGEP